MPQRIGSLWMLNNKLESCLLREPRARTLIRIQNKANSDIWPGLGKTPASFFSPSRCISEQSSEQHPLFTLPTVWLGAWKGQTHSWKLSSAPYPWRNLCIHRGVHNSWCVWADKDVACCVYCRHFVNVTRLLSCKNITSDRQGQTHFSSSTVFFSDIYSGELRELRRTLRVPLASSTPRHSSTGECTRAERRRGHLFSERNPPVGPIFSVSWQIAKAEEYGTVRPRWQSRKL